MLKIVSQAIILFLCLILWPSVTEAKILTQKDCVAQERKLQLPNDYSGLPKAEQEYYKQQEKNRIDILCMHQVSDDQLRRKLKTEELYQRRKVKREEEKRQLIYEKEQKQEKERQQAIEEAQIQSQLEAYKAQREFEYHQELKKQARPFYEKLYQQASGKYQEYFSSSTPLFIYVVLSFAFLITTLLKGKWGMALAGWLLPAIWIIGSIRLAKPDSQWARLFYDSYQQARSEERYHQNTSSIDKE